MFLKHLGIYKPITGEAIDDTTFDMTEAIIHLAAKTIDESRETVQAMFDDFKCDYK